jgi:hypothetical protein
MRKVAGRGGAAADPRSGAERSASLKDTGLRDEGARDAPTKKTGKGLLLTEIQLKIC